MNFCHNLAEEVGSIVRWGGADSWRRVTLSQKKFQIPLKRGIKRLPQQKETGQREGKTIGLTFPTFLSLEKSPSQPEKMAEKETFFTGFHEKKIPKVGPRRGGSTARAAPASGPPSPHTFTSHFWVTFWEGGPGGGGCGMGGD